MKLQILKYYSEQFSDSELITNTAGEHLFISKEDFRKFSTNPNALPDSTKAL